VHGSEAAKAALLIAATAPRRVHPVGVALSPVSPTVNVMAPAFAAANARAMARQSGRGEREIESFDMMMLH
jgi:hypothetical protein